jgi:hypothetical protein
MSAAAAAAVVAASLAPALQHTLLLMTMLSQAALQHNNRLHYSPTPDTIHTPKNT